MTDDVRVTMPLAPTAQMLRAVRSNPLTECEDKDQMNVRIGWLICAYEVMIEAWCKESIGRTTP